MEAAMQRTELTEEQKAEIAAEVDMVMNDWIGFWAGDLDFDRGMSFITDEPGTGWADNGQTFVTKAVVVATFDPFFASMESQTATVIESQTIVLALDVVHTTRVYDVVRVVTSGNEQTEFRHVETIVWVKRNGVWKILTGHGSSPPESV
jgi:hypothetical protein